MASKLEAAVNVSIIITCAAVVTAIGFGYVSSARTGPAAARRSVLEPGQRFPALAGMRLDSAERTLVMFLRADCQYCTDSMPFYQGISRSVTGRDGNVVQLVVVTSDTRQVATDYLQRNSLAAAGVVVPSADERRGLGIPGTPALVLVDKMGVVKHLWMGKLDAKSEAEVLAELFPADGR